MSDRAPAAAGSALILHGQVGPEATADDLDTLVQVRSVEAALGALGFCVDKLEFSSDLAAVTRRLAVLAPAFVFNLVEQVDGRDALLPLAGFLLDGAGIPYTGAPSAALAATTHKVMAKRLMAAAGIPTPDWEELETAPPESSANHAHWIVKSATEHASYGLSADSVVPAAEVRQRIRQCADEHGGCWFAERYIDGREFNVSLLSGEGGPQVLPVAEIEFVDFPEDRPLIVDYAAKWEPESVAYRNTRRRFMNTDEAPLSRRLGDIALECWRLFGLRGYARVDFRVDIQGHPWVLEINANPCLSPDAGFAAAADAADIGFADMVARIVRGSGMPLPEIRSTSAG